MKLHLQKKPHLDTLFFSGTAKEMIWPCQVKMKAIKLKYKIYFRSIKYKCTHCNISQVVKTV